MMNEWYSKPAKSVNKEIQTAAEKRQLELTKPPGSLGRLEDLAITLSAHQGSLAPAVKRIEIAIFAADHGVAEEGVSAFPQVVTGEMVKNFIRGGAAISVMARQLQAGLTVINAGTIAEHGFDAPVVDRPIALATKNITLQPAMSDAECDQALDLGREIVEGFDRSTDLIIGGEMGIANTTSASAISAALKVGKAADLVGPGTGLNQAGIELKLSVIEKALARCSAEIDGTAIARSVLRQLGGFEIAALVGYFIAAAQNGVTILVDGFISSTAALVACRINPTVRDWMLFAHGSAEPGHKLVLKAMDAEPLLNLSMRLGEGSGSAVAVALLRSACALQNEMATFAEAGVSDSKE